MKLKILPYPLKETKSFGSKINRTKLLVDEQSPRPKGKASLVSSISGKIKTLVFVYPKSDIGDDKYDYFPVIKEVIIAMPTVEKVLIIHRGNFSSPEIDAFLKEEQRVYPILTSNNNAELDLWIQDHFFAINYEEGEEYKTCFAIGDLDSNYKLTLEDVVRILDKCQYEGEDLFVQKLIFANTKLPFEGGNILVEKDFVLIGGDDKSLDYLNWFGTEPMYVESAIPLPDSTMPSSDNFTNILPFKDKSVQPIFHIDMFMTLVGFNEDKTEYTLVVGEPILGVEDLEKTDYELFKFLYKWLIVMECCIQSSIANLKRQFRAKGGYNFDFKIVRNPLVLTYADNVFKKNRKWFWATYNNCLVEVFKEGNEKMTKRVWLPSYGGPSSDYSGISLTDEAQKELDIILGQVGNPQNAKNFYGSWTELRKYDCQNKKIWESLGFEVSLMTSSYIPFIQKYGSLNCFTNCIERKL